MSIIADELNYLRETKELIRQSLVDKGSSILDTDSFRSYVNRVEELSIEGGTATNRLHPSMVTDLALWIDSTCNTETGFDESKLYVEPLVVNPNMSEQSSIYYGTYYKDSTKKSSSWDGKFLDLGANGAFKTTQTYFNDPMTIELVFKITETPTDTIRIMHAGQYALMVGLDTDGEAYFSTSLDGLKSLYRTELNKPYYIVMWYSSNNGVTIKSVTDNQVYENSDATITAPSANAYLGFGTAPGTTTSFTSSTTYSNGYGFGMCRCWNRLLTDKEINSNYEDIRKRFEF